MKRSTNRILTTHAGSLPRPADLLAMGEAKQDGKPVDAAVYEARLTEAVGEIVRRQAAIGIDVIDDGEYGKPGFVSYVNDRLGGFEPDPPRTGRNSWAGSREAKAFPEFYTEGGSRSGSRHLHMVCTGPITYRGHAQLRRDLDNFKKALAEVKVEEAFVPAISPSNVEDWQRNTYYKTQEEFLFAIADALHEEYQAIVDAGFLLQIDDPRLITYWIIKPEITLAECLAWAKVRVEALNHALRGIPQEKIRFHTCYGINMGPRVHDMELQDIVHLLLDIRAGAYSFEAANPRHEHEWKVWENVKLPDGKVLIPGVISNSTILVEHPELVAQRIERFAGVVGKENVIAGSDCGFATFATSKEIHSSIVWAKLEALAEGARIASKSLWR
jgi:5-methyltetrahydropteroyltriglutamate--homocysteine methyltransferase